MVFIDLNDILQNVKAQMPRGLLFSEAEASCSQEFKVL